MSIPLEYENLRHFIRLHNRSVTEMLRDPHAGASREYLWGARFMIKMLSRQWAADIIARRHTP